MYCNTDVLNYDNLDWINPVVAGETYYCVAFNVPVTPPAPVCDPVELIENGSFENPALSPSSYSIIPDSDSLLKWLVAWVGSPSSGILGLEIQNNVAGDSVAGSQHAELDGDHPVKISQTVTTVPGLTYALNFKYSPRPGRDAADNEMKVQVDGIDNGAVLSVDGTSNTNTVWSPETRTFTATGATTKIEFVDIGTDTSFGGYLDDVSLKCVVDVPPPTCRQDQVGTYPECYCPTGQHEGENECIPDVPPPTDVCSNIDGVQEIVPEGMTESNGVCTTPSSSGGGGGGGGFAQCADSRDNDSDGLIDSADPGCPD
jgi:hypothetical protein